MKLLFLTKKRYMRKDVIDDRYGRLYELPRKLSKIHDVRVIATDYSLTLKFQRLRTVTFHDDRTQWCSLRLNIFLVPTVIQYLLILHREFSYNRPDAVIGCSDSLHVILATLAGKLYGVRVLLDLYDNFDVFGLSKIPGIRSLYHHALSAADSVTCVSDKLSAYIRTNYRNHNKVYTIESVINTSDFYPIDIKEARRSLGLDPDIVYIGTAGALFANRGIKTIYESFLEIAKKRQDVRLLLAGIVDPGCPFPQHDNVIYLGDLEHSRMNIFFNSLDVALNYMSDDGFGRYSFPQKAYEMLASKRPVLSARVGDFENLLQDKFLYTPGDSVDLENKILALLDSPCCPDIKIPNWEEQSHKFDAVLTGITGC